MRPSPPEATLLLMSSTRDHPPAVPRQRSRVVAYVDGFNVYYGIREASRNTDINEIKQSRDLTRCVGKTLYWLDIPAVIRTQLRSGEELIAVDYFTAPRRTPKLVAPEDPEEYRQSNERQSVYLDALRTLPGLQVHLGWYSEGTPHRCRQCGYEWPKMEEKVTDVAIATRMRQDAFAHRFDVAFLVSADADLVPAVRAVQDAGKVVVPIFFPGRKQARHLTEAAAAPPRSVRVKTVRRFLLPHTIERTGLPPLRCPERWKPQSQWVWATPMPQAAAPPHEPTGNK